MALCGCAGISLVGGGCGADKGVYLPLETLPEFGVPVGCHPLASPPPPSSRASGSPPAPFRPFFTSPGEWREAPSPLAGLGMGGRSGALSGLTPPGCGLVAGTLETRAGFREGLSRGDIPEGLGVQLCERNQWNKRTAPGASLFGGGGREERLCRMGGGGRVSSPCWGKFVRTTVDINLTGINCGACLGTEGLYPSFSKVLNFNRSPSLAYRDGLPPAEPPDLGKSR